MDVLITTTLKMLTLMETERGIRVMDLLTRKCSLKLCLCASLPPFPLPAQPLHLPNPPLLTKEKMLFEITTCPTLGDKWNTLTPRLKMWISPIHILSFLQPKSRGVEKWLRTVSLGRAGEQCGREKLCCSPRVNLIYSQVGLGLYQDSAPSSRCPLPSPRFCSSGTCACTRTSVTAAIGQFSLLLELHLLIDWTLV